MEPARPKRACEVERQCGAVGSGLVELRSAHKYVYETFGSFANAGHSIIHIHPCCRQLAPGMAVAGGFGGFQALIVGGFGFVGAVHFFQ